MELKEIGVLRGNAVSNATVSEVLRRVDSGNCKLVLIV